MAKEEAVKARQPILNCPVCKSVRLVEETLEGDLVSANCPQCAGKYIDSGRYWAWLEQREGKAAEPAVAASSFTPLPVKDSGPGKFCPGCGRFLTRNKAGQGLDFFLDRCGGCGGIWLDANEWDNLKAHSLHDDIHFVFSDRWQAEVARQDRIRTHEHLLAEKLGPETLEEIKRVKTWLDGHPKKNELYAYLVGPKPDAPPPPSKR